MTDQTRSLEERFRNHPHFRDCVEALFAIMEDAGGNLDLADAAEMQVIAEIRRTGHTVLQGWAVNKEAQKNEEYRNTEKTAHSSGKKNFTGARRTVK
jgi:hypothetical protein